MTASVVFFIPLSTYNVKDFLNNFTKLPSVLFQKVFSMQISRAIGIKINKSQTSKEKFSTPVKKMRDDLKSEVAEDGIEDLDLKDASKKTAKVLASKKVSE
jgi:hypothetical protein